MLDEATSLIDPRTARTLEGSMNSLLSGRTVVAIAHRLHTAHDADRIAVVIDGRIAELGSHHELVERETASTPHSGGPGRAGRDRRPRVTSVHRSRLRTGRASSLAAGFASAALGGAHPRAEHLEELLETSGWSSRIGRNDHDANETVVSGVSARTVAERGFPSMSEISPK